MYLNGFSLRIYIHNKKLLTLYNQIINIIIKENVYQVL